MAGAALAHRGRLLGGLLMLLGAWGAIVPFVGPYFGYAFTPDKAWTYTQGRLWFSLLPGAAVFLGGLLVAASDRLAAPGAFVAALGGVWLVVGLPVTAFAVHPAISAGSPVVTRGAIFGPVTMRFLENLGFFYGLGVVALFFAAVALGELIVARMAARRYAERMEGFEREDQYGPAY
jgi:hypothetical protein